MNKISAATDYVESHPFTMAGFHKEEVDLIETAYYRSFLAGAQWIIDRLRSEEMRHALTNYTGNPIEESSGEIFADILEGK